MKKFIGIVGIIAIVVSLFLAGASVISWFNFWVVAGVVAFVAYFVLPRI